MDPSWSGCFGILKGLRLWSLGSKPRWMLGTMFPHGKLRNHLSFTSASIYLNLSFPFLTWLLADSQVVGVTCVCIYIYIQCIHLSINTSICMYTYTYIHIYIYTYICICMYRHHYMLVYPKETEVTLSTGAFLRPTFPPQTSAMERKKGFQRCLQFQFCRLLN